MKKYIFFLMGAVCFLLSSSAVHANELNKSDANIIGHVLDKNTEEHLSFISVSLKGTTIGTMTDASGHYFLKNLPEGEFTMEVSAVGYKTVSRKVTLRKGKTLEENFEIEEDLIALDGVVVSANRSETTRRMAPTLVNSLEHQGVKTIFGYPGGSIMPVFDALYDHRKTLNHILVRHEQGATHAAQGFARVSGEVGVCLVTSGPGATNTITGIADAMIDSTPLVVIAGQVGTGFLGTDAFQEVDLVGITQPITKWSYQIRSAEDVPWAVARAFYVAKSGRPGPVVLDFAKNAQVEKSEYAPAKLDYIRSYQPVPEMDEEAVSQAAELINSAERPLVLVGQGVELGDAQQELRAFIEKAGIPAGCTLLGLSALPTAHPLNKGMLGMHGNLGPNINTNKCDVLIAVGMRFDDRVTGKLDTYAKQAKIIHFDIDPAEIDKNVKTDIAVLGDCKETLAAVTALLKPATHQERLDSFLPLPCRKV